MQELIAEYGKYWLAGITLPLSLFLMAMPFAALWSLKKYSYGTWRNIPASDWFIFGFLVWMCVPLGVMIIVAAYLMAIGAA